MRLLQVLLGKPIRSSEDEQERVGPLTGVGVLGLDALGSAAYGPEALLSVLLPLGTQGLRHLGLISGAIIVLLAMLASSYWQTIGAYPGGGGAYAVVRENIGTRSALLAAAALLLDYLLNVAVAISAGIGALVSALPELLPLTLPLCLGVLALLTLINLRGVRSAGMAVLLPTYSFVVCLLAVIVWGVLGSSPAAAASHQEPPMHAPLGGLALSWLLIRAFANGCTAMTGVEAVSNGVPIFRPPAERGARRTLLLIVGILITLLAGIAWLCNEYGIIARPPGAAGYESVLSQLTVAVFGRGPLYYLTIGSVISVLALSANTSFAGFPRVCSMLARDRFLPEAFLHRGRRLSFSHGIWVLSGISGFLLCAFGGITDRLIPLFALGALGAFTAAQFGMVHHWRKQQGTHARLALGLNLVGGVATGLAAGCALLAKFSEGAWISLVLVAAMLVTFLGVRRHYDFVDQAIQADARLELQPLEPLMAVVPIRSWESVSLKALQVAMGLSAQVVVLQVLTNDRRVDDLRPRWRELVVAPAERAGRHAPQLVVKESEYRRVLEPLIESIHELVRQQPARLLAVVLPELVAGRWYHALLHGRTAALLRERLRSEAGPQVVIVSTPWRLRDWLPERRWLWAARRRPPARERGAGVRAGTAAVRRP
ncbi:MAG TPA: APC family permease [Polyangiaceae bacterium]|jgi:amino acid transporter|nr:APC family permease [Polyangiaceae bacterium]